jgi:hypothetical protein
VTRHALVVPFPGLAPVIDEWRERTCATKPSHGMPPHVTLLVPCPGDVATISEALAPFGGFDVTFAAVDRFPGTLWLAPEPAARFRWLTAALVAAFPGHPPYGGMFSEVVPHLTVAQAELDEAAADVVEWLPLHSRADAAVLFEQVQPDHWRERATFDLDAGEP